ncbi:MAG: YdhR family protein [Acidimicrobiales bacterium]
MHGLLITFTSAAQLDQLETPFTEYATALQAVSGLQSKAWIADGSTVGGFHVFDDRAAADAYLESELAAGLVGTDGFSNFQIRHFDILEGLSAITGVKARAAMSG